LLVLATLLVVSCSDSDDNPLSDPAAYVGEWQTSCIPAPTFPTSGFFSTIGLNVESNTWVYTMAAFVDENCTSQMAGERISGTITVAATYSDEGTILTTDGLTANVLRSSITSVTSTLEGSDETPVSTDSNTAVLTVHVDDVNQLFIDGSIFGLGGEPGSLLLTLPLTTVVR